MDCPERDGRYGDPEGDSLNQRTSAYLLECLAGDSGSDEEEDDGVLSGGGEQFEDGAGCLGGNPWQSAFGPVLIGRKDG